MHDVVEELHSRSSNRRRIGERSDLPDLDFRNGSLLQTTDCLITLLGYISAIFDQTNKTMHF